MVSRMYNGAAHEPVDDDEPLPIFVCDLFPDRIDWDDEDRVGYDDFEDAVMAEIIGEHDGYPVRTRTGDC